MSSSSLLLLLLLLLFQDETRVKGSKTVFRFSDLIVLTKRGSLTSSLLGRQRVLQFESEVPLSSRTTVIEGKKTSRTITVRTQEDGGATLTFRCISVQQFDDLMAKIQQQLN